MYHVEFCLCTSPSDILARATSLPILASVPQARGGCRTAAALSALSAQIRLRLGGRLFIKPNMAQQEAGLQKHAHVRHHKSTLEKPRHLLWREDAGVVVDDR